MPLIRQFIQRFDGILRELDALAEGLDGDAMEALEDMNAELEDALMLLKELKPTDADWREQLDGTLEDLCALARDYRAFCKGIPGVAKSAESLERLAEAARRDAED